MLQRIETLSEKKLIGQKIKMSFSNNKTVELWRNFMPRRKEISNNIGLNLFSIEIYDSLFFNDFNPEKEFEKWAAIEVTNFNNVPNEMEQIIFPNGDYAVFLHKGSASEGEKTYNYIFKTWLPHSVYRLDNRPHFAVMGEKYKSKDSSSEEEIWIPVKFKKIVNS